MKKKKSGFKIAFNAPVILSFTTICFVALMMNYFTAGYTNHLLFSTYRASITDPLTYVRFVGHVFGHGDWEHFINNMMLILIIGPLLEEKYGAKKMIQVILVTAILTGMFHNAVFGNVRLLGASGVVFAFILLASFTSIKGNSIPLTFILVAIVYIVGEIFDGLFKQDQISQLTHILGGVIGAAFGYRMNKGKKQSRLI